MIIKNDNGLSVSFQELNNILPDPFTDIAPEDSILELDSINGLINGMKSLG